MNLDRIASLQAISAGVAANAGIVNDAKTAKKDAWIYAVGSALFFGWMIAAAFPLAG